MSSLATPLNLRRIELGDVDSSSSEEEALSDVDDSNIDNKKVIILGAGVAGISAALFLKKHNVDAVVLEGRDRIGGRIYTDYHSFSAPVDLGAFIITGADPDVSRSSACDPCGPICRAFGMGLHYLDSRTLPLYHELHKETPIPQNIDRQSAALFDRILDGIAEMQSDSEEGEHAASDPRSLGEMFSQCLNEYVEKVELSVEDGSAIIGSTIQKPISIDSEMDASTTLSLKQKRMTGEAKKIEKQERDASSPIRKKLKITCKGQKDMVLDVFTKSKVGSGGKRIKVPSKHADRVRKGGKMMSLAQLCPAEKTKLQEAKERRAAPSYPINLVPRAERLTFEGSKSVITEAAPTRRRRGRPPKIRTTPPRVASENGHEPKVPNHLAASDPDAKVDVAMWHKAHLEYGCGTSLNHLSSAHWNQDEDYGGFNGRHAIVKGGLAPVVERLSMELDIRLEMVVEEVEYGSDGVRVYCKNGDVFEAGCVICTLPLGVLKSDAVKFSPPLPAWKQTAIESVGYGNLNKIVMEFMAVFWDASIDYFGIVPQPKPSTQKDVERQYDSAGFCFMWCTAYRYTGKPLLTGIISGAMADKVEEMRDETVIEMALKNLSSVFGDRVSSLFLHGKMTRWKRDVFSRGCYTHVPVGMSGRGYENLSHPLLGHGFGLLFGGEHTNKQHPDTIGGAMITGVREGKRALHLLYGPSASKRKVQVSSVQRARDQDASELLFKETEAEILRHR